MSIHIVKLANTKAPFFDISTISGQLVNASQVSTLLLNFLLSFHS